jgi:maltose alpha-D-glucosyltransferase/alpha-amylase
MIREAHKRGIRVIVDLVLNHMSKEHPWFVEARSSIDNPRRDYFIWSDTGTELKKASNAFTHAKPSNWIWNDATRDFYFATFYPDQPDLNWDNPEVMREIVAVMDFWVNKGADGFRLDAAPYLVKREGSVAKGLRETHKVLKRLRRHLNEISPQAVFLAEVHAPLKESKEYFGDGDECHMVYNFSLTEWLWYTLLTESKEGIRDVVTESADIPDNCAWATFLRNHDELSLSVLPKDAREVLFDILDPDRLYWQKKTQKTSMRIATAFKGDRDKMIAALEYLYSLPGSPVMYYGDEIGMQNLPHREGTLDSRRYVRGQFDWNEVARQMDDPNSLLNAVAKIIKAK